MRRTLALVAAFCTFLILACQPGVDDILPPAENPEEPKPAGKKLFEYESAVDYGGATIQDKCVVTEDTVQHTITMLVDSAKDSYTRYFYNGAGLLEKIRYNRIDTGFKEIDSIEIKRPGAGRFDIYYSGELHHRGTVKTFGDGSLQIEIGRPSGTGKYRTINVDKNGLISMIVYFNEAGKESARGHFYYDANKKLYERRDTLFSDNNPLELNTFLYTITKDGADNSHFIAMLEKFNGPDLEWQLYDRESFINAFRLDDTFPPYVYLQHGAITSVNMSVRHTSDGINFVDNGSSGVQYDANYDAKKRLTYHRYKAEWEEERIQKFKYPD